MLREVKTPSNKRWIESIHSINSFKRYLTVVQLIKIHIGDRIAVNEIKGIDISSRPKCRGPHLDCVEIISVQKLVLLFWKSESDE